MRRYIFIAIIAAVALAGCHKMEQMYTPGEGEMDWSDTVTMQEGAGTTPEAVVEEEEEAPPTPEFRVYKGKTETYWDLTVPTPVQKEVVKTTYFYDSRSRIEKITAVSDVNEDYETVITYYPDTDRIESIVTRRTEPLPEYTRREDRLWYDSDGKLIKSTHKNWTPALLVDKDIRFEYTYPTPDVRKAKMIDNPTNALLGHEKVTFANDLPKEIFIEEGVPIPVEDDTWTYFYSPPFDRLDKLDGLWRKIATPNKRHYIMEYVYTDDLLTSALLEVKPDPMPISGYDIYKFSDPVFDGKDLLAATANIYKSSSTTPETRVDLKYDYDNISPAPKYPPLMGMPTEMMKKKRPTMLFSNNPYLFFIFN